MAGLEGTYVAWVSSPNNTAAMRLGLARGWVGTDGRPIARSLAQLTAADLWYPLASDPFGDAIAMPVVVATGTAASGQAANNCGDWQDPDGVLAVGFATFTGSWWTAANAVASCNEPRRLYCFGADHQADVEIIEQTGRVAFRSQGLVSPAGGYVAMDELCQQEADSAGLSGTFLAFVTTDAGPPSARFSGAGERWVNTRGVPLAQNAADLLLGPDVLAPVQYTASGALASEVSALTGADSSGAEGRTCGVWTDASLTMDVTDPMRTIGWRFANAALCNVEVPVFCFEQ